MLVVGAELEGYALRARDGGIGRVSDLLFDDRSWRARWVVVNPDASLTKNAILVHPTMVGEPDRDSRALSVSLTRVDVKACPTLFDHPPVSLQMEHQLNSYANWNSFWRGSYFGAFPNGICNSFSPLDEVASAFPLLNSGNPHLRSVSAVRGYRIEAIGGEIGRLCDILVDSTGWHLRYLIVATRSWWAGRHVVVPPYSVREVSWADRKVALSLNCEDIQTSPQWNPLNAFDPEYEAQLASHYR
jgi:hypothetical protein